MRILIYDTPESDVIFLDNCVKTFLDINHISYTLDKCDNSEDLYQSIHLYDLIFLGIEMGNENGIDIGLRIRKQNKGIRIILVSRSIKHVIDGYKINAYWYFLKPFTKNKFNQEFEMIINQHFNDYEWFLDEKVSINRIYFKNILYIDYHNRKTRLHMLSGRVFITPYSLKYWEDLTTKHYFAKPYKSFIVNLRHITTLLKDEIILYSNVHIPISRLYKHPFMTNYNAFTHSNL